MEQGQTLIGVMVAAVTMLLLVLGITSLALATTRMLVDSERHAVALGIVNEQIEFIRSLSYGDVGFASGVGIPGILAESSGPVIYNGQTYDITIAVQYLEILGFPGLEDIKKVSVDVQWDTPSGRTREVSAVTYVSKVIKPKGCATCPAGRTCDPTVGFCLPDVAVAPVLPGSDCTPGLLCPDGSLCPISGSCPGADPSSLLVPSGSPCVPGQLCSNGALCLLSGVCPAVTCPRGECQESDVCFSGFCYPPEWYEFSFPADDGSGPGFTTPMMCQDASTGGVDLCVTSADCPAACDNGDGVNLVWQCEQTWVPDCRDGNAGGAMSSCRGGYNAGGNCSDLECDPGPCPLSGQCNNGEECGTTSSGTACASNSQCPTGEICAGTCRTICPVQSECRTFWGGYAMGCKVYAITGAVAGSAPACPAG